MSAVRIIVIGIVLSSLFFLVAFNPIKNSASDNLSKQYPVSVPTSTENEITLSGSNIATSSFASNQTDVIQDGLQQSVLSTTVTVPIKTISLKVIPELEKLNSAGVIKDRINLDSIKIFSYITNANSNDDLQNDRLRLSLNLDTEKPFQQVNLSGSIMVILNDVIFAEHPFFLIGETDELGEGNVKFTNAQFLELEYKSLVPKLAVDKINTLKIDMVSLKGTANGTAFDIPTKTLFTSDIDYSQFKVIAKNENGLVEKVYPSDSSLTIKPEPSDKLRVECEWSGFYTPCRTRIYNDGVNPAPIVTDINIYKDGSLVRHLDQANGIPIPLQRNSIYHVTVGNPSHSYDLVLPDDEAVSYTFSCVVGSPNTVCGHP